jgi:hypothetical protein
MEEIFGFLAEHSSSLTVPGSTQRHRLPLCSDIRDGERLQVDIQADEQV